jgi:hypothetical protein
MTQKDFLEGKKFNSYNLPDRVYMFVKSKKENDEPGRIDEEISHGYNNFGSVYSCNVKKVTKTGFEIYKTIMGKIIKMRLKFSDYETIIYQS